MKWNSGILVGFQKSIQIKKSSYQTWLESINQIYGEKSAYEIKSRVTSRSQAFIISFFFAAAPPNHSGISYLYGYGISIFEPNAYETS